MPSPPEVIAYISVGSNQGDSRFYVREAAARLNALPLCRVLRTSSWYRSTAVGPGAQPDYINGVFEISTSLTAEELLDTLLSIETLLGRVRNVRWGPRTLDLDLLLYGNLQLNSPRLQLPHPRLGQRNFVVYPLFDLAPRLTLPDGTALATLRDTLNTEGLYPIDCATEEAGV